MDEALVRCILLNNRDAIIHHDAGRVEIEEKIKLFLKGELSLRVNQQNTKIKMQIFIFSDLIAERSADDRGRVQKVDQYIDRFIITQNISD